MKLTKYVKFREEKFGGVLFETRTEKVFTLNPAATAVIRAIQAGCDAAQITERLKSSFHDPRGMLEVESAQFLADLKHRGLVEDS